MECPICFEIIKNSCVGSCMHHFCYTCLVKWISFGGCKCPNCKRFIYEIKFDREFDELNNNTETSLTSEYTKKIMVYFEDNVPPGITICPNSGPGVKIVKLNKQDKCYNSGLKVGDIILFLNNVPCNTHADAILIIKDSFERKRELCFELLILKNNC